jgi:hypothetical protein
VTRQRLCLFMTLVVALAALWPAVARAEVSVTGLRLSLVRGGTPDHRFPPGTREIYAAFDYASAVNHRIGVVVTARGGISVFESAKRYTGAGSDSVTIDGTSITQALANALAEASQLAQSNAQLAATQPAGVQERLQMVQESLLRAQSAIYLLRRLDLGQANTDRLAVIQRANREATDLVTEALGLLANQLDQKQALATQMAAPLAEAGGAAQQLAQSVGRLSGLPLPETGNDARAAYTVQLRVMDYPAASAEFTIAQPPSLFVPWCSRSTPLSR